MEHGTIRDRPYAPSAAGRLTALAYQSARHVFVTNQDCLQSARTLCGTSFTMINHPYDDQRRYTRADAEPWRGELQQLTSAEHLIFFPTRHDWVVGPGRAHKANDVLLRGFAALRDSGVSVGLVCCDWGQNVRQSRQLLDDLGVAGHVHWVRVLERIRFERTVAACDVVADQFSVGAFGGITFKALALGAPVCTYLDMTRVREAYPEPPPVINCRTPDEIARGLRAVLTDAAARRDLSARSRQWIERYHSSRETVDRQLRQFAEVLAPGG
jgi:glycosyltransferase involved in cell wall biosynthesis